MVIQGLVRALTPWQSLYARSSVLSTTVTTVHIIALLIGGGLALAADRTTLRVLHRTPEQRALQLSELHAVHRPVLIALVVLFFSGVLLAAADVETFAASKLFWIKLGLVALLMANGLVLYLAESGLRVDVRAGEAAPERLWRRLGMSARISIGLWVVTAVAGTVLTNA